jgi:hypothetical protein
MGEAGGSYWHLSGVGRGSMNVMKVANVDRTRKMPAATVCDLLPCKPDKATSYKVHQCGG